MDLAVNELLGMQPFHSFDNVPHEDEPLRPRQRILGRTPDLIAEGASVHPL